jgi:hypothetical protein
MVNSKVRRANHDRFPIMQLTKFTLAINLKTAKAPSHGGAVRQIPTWHPFDTSRPVYLVWHRRSPKRSMAFDTPKLSNSGAR